MSSSNSSSTKTTSKKARKAPTQTPTRAMENRQIQAAQELFSPKGKNPYYFNGKPLANLQELVDYLVAFTGEEGSWVASWIEYLGDSETAEHIRNNPGDFKQIVTARFTELKKYLEHEATM